MYNKKTLERHNEALDKAESLISASIAGTENYGDRLTPYQDDLLEIACLFWDRCPVTRKKLELPGRDAKDMARKFMSLIRSSRFNMWERRNLELAIERCRRKCKGQLLGTRMILADKDKKGNCEDEANHASPCFCKALNLHNLAQAEEMRGA